MGQIKNIKLHIVTDIKISQIGKWVIQKIPVSAKPCARCLLVGSIEIHQKKHFLTISVNLGTWSIKSLSWTHKRKHLEGLGLSRMMLQMLSKTYSKIVPTQSMVKP